MPTLPAYVDAELQERAPHGSKDFPIQYYADELALCPNRTFPIHWHPELEFFICCGGQARHISAKATRPAASTPTCAPLPWITCSGTGKKSKEFLLDSSKSIQEVSFSCGFLSSGYFSRCFREQTDMTAAQYRRQ